jgi:hypothetical protein
MLVTHDPELTSGKTLVDPILAMLSTPAGIITPRAQNVSGMLPAGLRK